MAGITYECLNCAWYLAGSCTGDIKHCAKWLAFTREDSY